jgi:2-polyprenyl-3-methyl-5-hydroxy-6-metoxy-1,4-benzoquinol methylase
MGDGMSNVAFDEDYYRRWYGDAGTRAHTQADRRVEAAYVMSALGYMRVPVKSVVDVGCGVGHWRTALREINPAINYTGVEVSDFACQRFGWIHSSADQFLPRQKFDLVICQQVLQHLDNKACAKALANMASYCRGALFLQVVTRGDWDGDMLDKARTEHHQFLRTLAWYRKQLAPHFIGVGGGLFLARRAKVPTFELEKT